MDVVVQTTPPPLLTPTVRVRIEEEEPPEVEAQAREAEPATTIVPTKAALGLLATSELSYWIGPIICLGLATKIGGPQLTIRERTI